MPSALGRGTAFAKTHLWTGGHVGRPLLGEVNAVDALGLSVREIHEAVRACAHIRVPDTVPDYLQEFLVIRLRARDPAAAAKVANLSPSRCAELFRLIRALQHDCRDA
jgi:hypothetical protein